MISKYIYNSLDLKKELEWYLKECLWNMRDLSEKSHTNSNKNHFKIIFGDVI